MRSCSGKCSLSMCWFFDSARLEPNIAMPNWWKNRFCHISRPFRIIVLSFGFLWGCSKQYCYKVKWSRLNNYLTGLAPCKSINACVRIRRHSSVALVRPHFMNMGKPLSCGITYATFNLLLCHLDVASWIVPQLVWLNKPHQCLGARVPHRVCSRKPLFVRILATPFLRV